MKRTVTFLMLTFFCLAANANENLDSTRSCLQTIYDEHMPYADAPAIKEDFKNFKLQKKNNVFYIDENKTKRHLAAESGFFICISKSTKDMKRMMASTDLCKKEKSPIVWNQLIGQNLLHMKKFYGEQVDTESNKRKISTPSKYLSSFQNTCGQVNPKFKTAINLKTQTINSVYRNLVHFREGFSRMPASVGD